MNNDLHGLVIGVTNIEGSCQKFVRGKFRANIGFVVIAKISFLFPPIPSPFRLTILSQFYD